MRPTFSIIFFTTSSGAGYGLLFMIALLNLRGQLDITPIAAVILMFIGLSLVSAGLISSTLHLGNPQRAWRAISQWKTSWLSREGVMAIITYAPALLLTALFFFDATQTPLGIVTSLFLCLCAILTVITTANIYASLKTIPAWHHLLVTPIYLVLAATSGSVLLFCAMILLQGMNEMLLVLTTVLLVVSLMLKRVYWRDIDQKAKANFGGSTPEDATGLGYLGKVRSLEHPHSQANWVMREMGFMIAREHSQSLRMLCTAAFTVAIACIILAGLLQPIGAFTLVLAFFTLLLLGVAILIERWLLFAEAKHVVTNFYA